MKVEKRWNAEYEVTVVSFTDKGIDAELVVDGNGQSYLLYDNIRGLMTRTLPTKGRSVDELIKESLTAYAVLSAKSL